MLPVLAAAGMLVPVAIPAVAAQAPAPVGAVDVTGGQADDDVIAESLRLRGEFGFDADGAKLASILKTKAASAPSAEAGTQSLVNEWGFIGTAAEAAEMKRRDTLTSAVEPMVQKFAEHNDFAGHFLDTENGGRLVVQFADALPAEQTRNELTATALSSGSSTDDVEFRVVQRSSAELSNAMKAVWKWDESAADAASVVSVEEDVAANRLNVALRPGTDPAGVRETLGKLGVPATITEGEGADLACTSRNKCASPRRGGVGITMPSGGGCTIGWVVKKGSSWGAVTAGHCDWGRNSGTVKSGAAYGSLTSNNALKSGTHADMRFVKISGSAKPWLYQNNANKARVVKKKALGSVGSTSCIFGRNAANPRCGKITSTNVSRRSSTCNCVVYGQSAATFSAAPGDSGGAVASSTTGNTARGILSGTDGAGKMHYSWIGYTSTYGMGNLATG
ncbi:hypothetical protein ACFU3E_08285 [Streptomyces sp. NPDC057424]|uniref:hypothetical protein n=1 Tax=Streptomyces sp. NPDC057424 TaxID=3346127 RepID=UPI00367B5B1A